MTRPTTTARFATCDLCDAHKNDSSGRFRVLPPVFRPFGGVSRFCGPVVTLQCFEDNSLVKAAVDGSGLVETPAGRVPAVLAVASASATKLSTRGSTVLMSTAKVAGASVLASASTPMPAPALKLLLKC